MNQSRWLQFTRAKRRFPFGTVAISVSLSLWCRAPLETSRGWNACTFSFELCLFLVVVASSNFSWTVGGRGALLLFLKPATLPRVETWLQPRCLQNNLSLKTFVLTQGYGLWLVHQTTVYSHTLNGATLLPTGLTTGTTSRYGFAPFRSQLVPHFETVQKCWHSCRWEELTCWSRSCIQEKVLWAFKGIILLLIGWLR